MVRYVFFTAYHVLSLWVSFIIRYDVILFKDRSEKLEAYVDRLYEAWVALLSSPISFTLCLFQDGVIVKGVASYHCIFIIFNIVIIITPLGLVTTQYLRWNQKSKIMQLSSNHHDYHHHQLHSTPFARCQYPRWNQNHRLCNSPLHSVCPLSISKMDVGLAVT